ncbi:MAG: cytochrome C [Pseudomonadota bacterium]
MTTFNPYRCIGIALLLGAIGMAGCVQEPYQSRGFALPDGDEDMGRMAFIATGCHGCHTVTGIDLPEPIHEGPVSVQLGGEVTRIKSYGELVTSVINPSHKLIAGYARDDVTAEEGESLMPDFNTRISVQDLIDIVAFLSPRYEVVPPESKFPMYHY